MDKAEQIARDVAENFRSYVRNGIGRDETVYAFSVAIASALRSYGDERIEECAAVVDECNREGPYNAIGAAARIRALATTPQPKTRDAHGYDAADLARMKTKLRPDPTP